MSTQVFGGPPGAVQAAAATEPNHTVDGGPIRNFVFYAKSAVFGPWPSILPNADLADQLARAVTDHATPVGSGTVARTKRIPVEQRAEAAVIAWMRHKTTGYEGMAIPRVKGKRREVRRMLAARSKELLARYRQGGAVTEGCPLRKALVGGLFVQNDRSSGARSRDL